MVANREFPSGLKIGGFSAEGSPTELNALSERQSVKRITLHSEDRPIRHVSDEQQTALDLLAFLVVLHGVAKVCIFRAAYRSRRRVWFMLGWAANAFDITEIAQSTLSTWMHVVLGDAVIDARAYDTSELATAL